VLKSSGVVEAFAYLEKMVKEGVFQEGFGVMDDATSRSMLEDGKAAMYTSGNWTTGLLDQEAPELKYDIFPLPENNGDTRIIIYQNNSLCIPSNVSEEKIPVILEYLNKTISSEYAITSYKHGQISASKNLTTEQIAEVASPMTTKAVELANECGGGLWYGIWWPAPMWDAALQSMNNIINGTWTPEEAANHLYETGVSELEQKQQ
jgi:ABC-type glycerol-3-phosphate transport system substrate-binding protein